jgi:hypothetical protein
LAVAFKGLTEFEINNLLAFNLNKWFNSNVYAYAVTKQINN